MPSAIPNVVGDTLPEAVEAILSSGYIVGGVTLQFSSTVSVGVVISQNPAAQVDTGRLTDELGGLLETESGQPIELESGPGIAVVAGHLTTESGVIITTESGVPINLESGAPVGISLVVSLGVSSVIHKVTRRVMSYLHRIFDKNPYPHLAFRIQATNAELLWSICDGILTLNPLIGRVTTETGGILQTESGDSISIEANPAITAVPYSFSIANFTISGLASFLAALPGYSVPYQDLTAYGALSALALLDSNGDTYQSNGDHVYGYTSLLWAYVESNSSELGMAKAQIVNALQQMTVPTAQDEWLDFHGGYYKVPRIAGELDAAYAPRIIAEVLQPRGNNVAMAAAIQSIATGAQKVRVIDSIDDIEIVITYNGEIFFDGSHFFDAGIGPGSLYGFFDVDFSYDFSGPVTQSTYFSQILTTVQSFRDAGTQLKTVIFRNNGSDTTIVSDTFVGGVRVIVYDDYSGEIFRLLENGQTRLTEDGIARVLES